MHSNSQSSRKHQWILDTKKHISTTTRCDNILQTRHIQTLQMRSTSPLRFGWWHILRIGRTLFLFRSVHCAHYVFQNSNAWWPTLIIEFVWGALWNPGTYRRQRSQICSISCIAPSIPQVVEGISAELIWLRAPWQALGGAHTKAAWCWCGRRQFLHVQRTQ